MGRAGGKAGARRPDVARIRRRVLDWYATHGRTFPWREHRDPYKTLVAEVMLQQTQTGRVGPAYAAFLQRFPTSTALARAPAMEVIRAWKGLGYNRRAVDLQRAAQMIESQHGGSFPSEPHELRALPGVGEYSAHAVACFAFDAQVPVVDVNVRRVLARAALGVDEQEAAKDAVHRVAVEWLPQGEAYAWNQALMDVGATLCRSGRPLCTSCPLHPSCAYRSAGRHRAPAAARAPKEQFEGSRRQRRGGIVDELRAAAAGGMTLGVLAKALNHAGPERDLSWLVELLEGLARDGLVELTPAARRGSPRGVVRLPR